MAQHKWHKEIAISIIVLLSLTGCMYEEKCIDGKVYVKYASGTFWQYVERECVND